MHQESGPMEKHEEELWRTITSEISDAGVDDLDGGFGAIEYNRKLMAELELQLVRVEPGSSEAEYIKARLKRIREDLSRPG
jgi:hypothetical protein